MTVVCNLILLMHMFTMMIFKSPDHAISTERHTGTNKYDVNDNNPELESHTVSILYDHLLQ